jgi:hypothetical protein
VHAQVRTTARNVGYVMGSGDAGPEVLREMGAAVTLLEDGDLESGDLSRFDVIVVGVRAYNTRPRLRAFQSRLKLHGERRATGGPVPDRRNGLRDRIGPYPLTVSRDRVTVEQAEMRTGSKVIRCSPRRTRSNPATTTAGSRSAGSTSRIRSTSKYEAVLSLNDPNEPARRGALLYAKYGKGTFIYTGLAFFPAAAGGCRARGGCSRTS